MRKTLSSPTYGCVLLCVVAACGRDPLLMDEGADAGRPGAAGAGGNLQGGGGSAGVGAGGAVVAGGAIGSGGVVGRGGAGGVVGGSRGGAVGSGGIAGTQGTGGGIVIRRRDGGLPPLPDGGLSTLLGDGGIVNGILDAPRDSLIGQVICGPEVRTGAACPSGSQGCLLPSLGGVCMCANGTYICPANTTAEPQRCPDGAATDAPCLSPLTTCVGGGATVCVCGLGTYICY